jgi:NAD(P)-dependent dehydrogenase (short-subunit alcohol dehydrogenase family)
MTAITGKIVLITGANRGIGRGLLEEALRRGAQQVYAGTRESFARWSASTPPSRQPSAPSPTRESSVREPAPTRVPSSSGLARIRIQRQGNLE